MANDEGFLYDNSGEMEVVPNAETAIPDIDNKGSQVRKLMPRDPAEIGNLPVFGYELNTVVEDDDGIFSTLATFIPGMR